MEVIPDNSSPDDNVVLAALDKTGFLLERRVHLSLQRAGFNSFIGSSFRDPESDKTRELDVLGIQSYPEPSIPGPHVFSFVPTECKRWTAPLVGIGGPPTEQDKARIPNEYSISRDPYRHDRTPARLDSDVWSLYHGLNLQNLDHPVRSSGFLASQIVLMEQKGGRWLATNDGIFDSVVIPLVKAHLKNVASSSESGLLDEDVYFHAAYQRPVLVTTAPLITVSTRDDGEVVVDRPKWFPVFRELDTRYFTGRFSFECVNADHVDEWLSRVVDHHRAIGQRIADWSRTTVSRRGSAPRT